MSTDRFIVDAEDLIITPPVKKDAEELEKYNTCHGPKGRFCSGGGGGRGGGGGGGGGDGGGGGGTSASTVAARGSGGDLPPWMQAKPKPAQPAQPATPKVPLKPKIPGKDDVIGGVRDAPGARTGLKAMLGQEVTVTFTAHHQGGPSFKDVGYSHFLKDLTVTNMDKSQSTKEDHLWLQNAPAVIRNAKPGRRDGSGGTLMRAKGIVDTYVKDAGRDYEVKNLRDIEVIAVKGIDVADVHVAGPSWRGKKRSEMTKEELAECEKARGCPKIKKNVELFKLDDDQRLIYGVVLVPDVEDLQGDICSKEDIQEAAHDYLVNSRLIKAQHRAPTDADVVECYIAPIDIPLGKGIAPAGSWVMVTKVHSEAMWTAVKKGEVTGYSIGGRGTREEIT